jgi:hypothetical protein
MNLKRLGPFVLLLAGLSVLSGYLMSKASFVGRLGMTFVYKEYRFLKTWWKGAVAVFIVWMILLAAQEIIQKKLPSRNALIIHAALIILALVGLYFTYSDFQHTTTHRWLKERFHIGAYLFWIGWIMICIFYIVQKRKPEVVEPPVELNP